MEDRYRCSLKGECENNLSAVISLEACRKSCKKLMSAEEREDYLRQLPLEEALFLSNTDATDYLILNFQASDNLLAKDTVPIISAIIDDDHSTLVRAGNAMREYVENRFDDFDGFLLSLKQYNVEFSNWNRLRMKVYRALLSKFRSNPEVEVEKVSQILSDLGLNAFHLQEDNIDWMRLKQKFLLNL